MQGHASGHKISKPDPFRSFEKSLEIIRLAVMMCFRVFAKINGKRRYLGRTTDHEGEVPEAYVTKYGNNGAPKKFVRKLMKRHGQADEVIPDRFASFEFASRRHSSVDLPKSNTLGRSIDFFSKPSSTQPIPKSEVPWIVFYVAEVLEKDFKG